MLYAYMQCVDPGKPYTEGGTVIFIKNGGVNKYDGDRS